MFTNRRNPNIKTIIKLDQLNNVSYIWFTFVHKKCIYVNLCGKTPIKIKLNKNVF